MTRAEFNLKLNKLVSVQLLHTYYDDRQCRDFTIVPTPETEKTLRNYHLTARTLNINGYFGFMVFFDPVRTPNVMKKPEWRPEKLSFLLLNNNSYFLNFTSIPFLRQHEAVYFSNLNGHLPKEGPALLHKDAVLTASKAEVLHLRERRFAHLFAIDTQAKGKKDETGVSFSQVQVKNAWGDMVPLADPAHYELHPTQGTVPDQPRIEEAKAYPQLQHQFDLSSQPSGKYQILPGSKGFLEANVYTLDRLPNNCVGVVDLFLGDKVDKALQLIDPKATEKTEIITPRDFAIQFEARSTIWRYYFINPKSVEYSDHSIANKGKGPGYKFGAAQPVALKDQPMSKGTPAVLMTSADPIQLRQFPAHRLELNMKKNGNGRTIIKLPSPRVETVKADHQAPDQLFSDIYVYV